MNGNERAVISAMDYCKIDGRNAPDSGTAGLALALGTSEGTAKGELTARVLQSDNAGGVIATAELPLHQIFDMAILSCETLLYFGEAYRLPKLYDPESPTIKRGGLQGDAMTVRVCTESPTIDADIAQFSQELSNQGELIGERVRTLARLLAEIG